MAATTTGGPVGARNHQNRAPRGAQAHPKRWGARGSRFWPISCSGRTSGSKRPIYQLAWPAPCPCPIDPKGGSHRSHRALPCLLGLHAPEPAGLGELCMSGGQLVDGCGETGKRPGRRSFGPKWCCLRSFVTNKSVVRGPPRGAGIPTFWSRNRVDTTIAGRSRAAQPPLPVSQ